MAEQSIRFGIHDQNGFRAATWKLFTPKGKTDIYLTCRELGGMLKTSLHESGKWHYAYSQNAFEKYVKPVDINRSTRFIDKWERPKPIIDGITLAFKIITPCEAVTSPIVKSKTKIYWIPNCNKGAATEVDIYIISSNTIVENCPGSKSMDAKLVGKYNLENGDSIWVTHRVIQSPIFNEKIQANLFEGRNKEDVKLAKRALGLSLESGVLYDFSIKYEVSE